MNSIQHLIEEMIKKCLELGHQPKELWLTDHDYEELMEDLDFNTEPRIEVTPTGVIWNENPVQKELKEYKGLRVSRSDITRILW